VKRPEPSVRAPITSAPPIGRAVLLSTTNPVTIAAAFCARAGSIEAHHMTAIIGAATKSTRKLMASSLTVRGLTSAHRAINISLSSVEKADLHVAFINKRC
jgi:hypothetical protein